MDTQTSLMEQMEGTPTLLINRSCSSNQLLVSLCRNGNEWLSPVGWTKAEKGTLLDCRADKNQTRIEIPGEFARDLKNGDRLVLRCSELDFEQNITWNDVSIDQDTAEKSGKTLFSRFSRKKKSENHEVAVETTHEAQRRAEEAERAAQTYKAKMEAAAEARRKAELEAKKAAEQAERAAIEEAERVAEMESASQAYEEAERLRQDELRRLEKERKAEEDRLAEEARLVEEARQREEDARKAAERQAAMEAHLKDIESGKLEGKRLSQRLDELKTNVAGFEADVGERTQRIDSLKTSIMAMDEARDLSRKEYDKEKSNLASLETKLQEVRSVTDETQKTRERLTKRLSQADNAYSKAQKDVEIAKQKAAEKLAALDAVRNEDSSLASQLEAQSVSVTEISNKLSAKSTKVDKLKVKHEKAETNLRQEKESLRTEESLQSKTDEQLKTAKHDLALTRRSITDNVAKVSVHERTLAQLEDEQNMSDIEPVADPFLAKADNDRDGGEPPKSNRRSRRNRRALSRGRDKSIVLEDASPVEDLTDAVKAPVESVDPTVRTNRNKMSLLTIAVMAGGLAVLGTASALNFKKPTTQVTSNTTPAKVTVPEKIATQTAIPETTETDALKAEPVKTALLSNSVLSNDTKDMVPVFLSSIKPTQEGLITEASILNSRPEALMSSLIVDTEISPIVSDADVIDGAESVSVKALEDSEAPKKVASKREEPKPIAIPAAKREEPVKAKTPEAPKPVNNYRQVTERIQSDLTSLGMYSGDLNGQLTPDTTSAIRAFKQLYGMPINNELTGAFLNELKIAANQAEATLRATATQAEPVEAIKVADTSGTPVLFNAPDQALESIQTDVSSETEPVAVSPAPVQDTAELTTTVPTRVDTATVSDNIVEAVLVRPASADYPKRAIQGDHLVNVSVDVIYDIDAKGKVQNVELKETAYTGKYDRHFIREAIIAVKRQRFEPKTVNGVPAISTGHVRRITFLAE